jgi:hypothetical protein
MIPAATQTGLSCPALVHWRELAHEADRWLRWIHQDDKGGFECTLFVSQP